MSAWQKEHISEAFLKSTRFLEHKHSDESKDKMSTNRAGKGLGPQTPEHIAKAAAARKGMTTIYTKGTPCIKCGTPAIAIGEHTKGQPRYRCEPCFKDGKAAYQRKLKYGITKEQYSAMVEEQEGKCKCCGKIPQQRGGLRVDHIHDTGIIRGLLCTQCNLGIGLLGDDLKGARNAVAYLLAQETVQT